jgi:RNA polymerase sigma-70 factor, ECF subfamily
MYSTLILYAALKECRYLEHFRSHVNHEKRMRFSIFDNKPHLAPPAHEIFSASHLIRIVVLAISRNLFELRDLLRIAEMAGVPDPDAALMLRVKQGDAAAFEDLVEKYKQPVLNLLYRTVRDLTEAEDLAQNVFVQVFKSADRYRVEAKFSTWLFTIARNLALNEIRRRSRHPAESLEASLETQDELPARQFEDRKNISAPDQLLQRELAGKVEDALASLPENQRTAILLFKEKEMSYDDISEILGCSLSATKSLIHRGRETLKEKLKPYLRSGRWND